MKKVLVCLDGSERSERSLPWVRLLARKSEIVLLRVVEPVYALDVYASALSQELQEAAEVYLKKIASTFSPAPKTIFRLGPSAHSILEVAKDQGADLIAITTHGGADIGRRLFGGTAEKLIHSSEVPLLIVPSWREAAPPKGRISTIVAPLDGSDVSEKILPLARRFAEQHDAELILAHVLTGPEEVRKRFAEIDGHFQGLATRMRDRWVKVRTLIKYGRAVEEILDVTTQTGADIVVMSAHGYGALKRIFVGSVASRVIGEAGVPVIVANHHALTRQPRA